MSDKIAVRDQLVKIISSMLGKPVEQISDKDHFTKDLGLDSLDIIELLMDIEDNFEIEISDEEAEKAILVGDLVDLIHKIV